MATIEDASMPDAPVIETIDFSEGALEWLQANRQKLEDMVKRKQNMYNLEEWEEFERWSYNQSEKLTQARAQQQTMKREWQKMQDALDVARAQASFAQRELQKMQRIGETFSSAHPDYRTGVLGLERLVCNYTRAEGLIPLLPAGGEERIADRLDKLVERMAHVEKKRMEAGEAQRQEDDDFMNSTLATRGMHNLLHFR